MNHPFRRGDQAGGRNKMFDWLIPALIAIILLIKILDYLDLLDIVATAGSLLAAAIAGTARFAVRLARRQSGASKPQS